MICLKLIITPEAKKWLAAKGIDDLTIGVIISRGGGCCGGCSFTEPVIDHGKPKEKIDSYYFIDQDGLKVYVAKIYEKKTDALTVDLKGLIFKRLFLDGYEAECPLNSS